MQAMDDLCAAADRALQDGANILILSDRQCTAEHAAIPALLAVAGVHHHLIRQGTRTRVGIIVESGEPREMHHFSLLIGYGAGAVNPYLAIETIEDMIAQGMITDSSVDHAVQNYVKAVIKGVVKVMTKMGICTIDGYRGAQIFEALGLAPSVVDRYFTGTPIACRRYRHRCHCRRDADAPQGAFSARGAANATLETGGQYQWRSDGEHHTFNPLTVHKLQMACRNNDFRALPGILSAHQ